MKFEYMYVRIEWCIFIIYIYNIIKNLEINFEIQIQTKNNIKNKF